VRKPANRPSRRHHLVDAAVELFSLEPWEVITVADIVERAGMTPATFYYHFSSREELLEEIVRDFAQKWLGMVERLLDSAETPDELCAVAMALLDEIDATGQEAKIFFLSTAKEPLMAERIRSDARRQLIRLGLAEPHRMLGPRRFRAELAKLSRVATGFAVSAEQPS